MRIKLTPSDKAIQMSKHILKRYLEDFGRLGMSNLIQHTFDNLISMIWPLIILLMVQILLASIWTIYHLLQLNFLYPKWFLQTFSINMMVDTAPFFLGCKGVNHGI